MEKKKITLIQNEQDKNNYIQFYTLLRKFQLSSYKKQNEFLKKLKDEINNAKY